MMETKAGTTRTVILVGRYALKIPSTVEWRLFLHGLLSNMREVQFAKTGWPELCPVIFSLPGGFLVVMKRARALTRAEFDTLDLEAWVDRGDYVVPAEIKMDSFGYLNDQLVAVDYGS